MTQLRLTTVIVVVLVVAAGLAVGPSGVAGTTHGDADCSYPLQVTDATGSTVTIEEEPETIVTLAPSAAATLWAIDAREKVVGVSMHAGYLDGADERTNVSADPMSTDLETVVDLDPDLVLAPNVTPHGEVEELRELGLNVFHFESATSVEDVLNKTALIGALSGACEGAESTVEEARTTLDRVEGAVPAGEGVPIAYFTLGDGYTPGIGTFQHDAIERAGLRNLAADADIEGWATVSEEVVVDIDPAWIIHTNAFPEPPVGEAVEGTTAMQEGQVVVLDANAISQPAPQLIDAIVTLHESVYGELATPTPTATATPTATPSPTSTPTETATPQASPTETDPSDGIPGFQVSLAVLALAAAALAGRIRHR